MIHRHKYHLALFIIIIFHLILLSKIVFFPYPEFFVYSYLTDNGLLPYKQIFDQHFPGIMFLPLNFSSLGLLSVEGMRFVHLVTVAITQIMLYFTTRKLFKSEKLALVTSLLYLVWQPYFEGYVLWIDTLVTPLILLAFLYLVNWSQKPTRKDLIKTSLLLGACLMFKQVVIPLIFIIAVYVYSKRKDVKEVLFVLIGPIAAGIFMLVYFYLIDVIRDFWFWTVEFNLGTFNKMGRKAPNLKDLIKVSVVYGFSIIIVVKNFLQEKKIKNKIPIELYIFLFGSLMFAYARFDYIHLQPSLPFAIILLVFVLTNLRKQFATILVAVHISFSIFLFIPFYKNVYEGGVYFFGESEYRLANTVKSITNKEDKIFMMGTLPHLHYMADRLPAGNQFVFQFPWFMVEAEDRILAGIKEDSPKVVVRDKNAATQGFVLVKHMEKINKYIDDNYQAAIINQGIEIMVPK